MSWADCQVPEMDLAFHPAPRRVDEAPLMILLPGFQIDAGDFVTHGFVAAAHERLPTADLLVVEPSLDLYLDGTVGKRLVALIAEHCLGRRLFVGAISLGCFGALLAAMEQEGVFAKAILLAPFLGTPGLIAEVARAGGLSSWYPGELPANDNERRLLAWLKAGGTSATRNGPFFLGYGRSDRFAAAAALFATCLPSQQVLIVEGAHDWVTWKELWWRILAIAFGDENSSQRATEEK